MVRVAVQLFLSASICCNCAVNVNGVPKWGTVYLYGVFNNSVKVHGTIKSQYNDQQGNASNTPFRKSLNGRRGSKRARKGENYEKEESHCTDHGLRPYGRTDRLRESG